MSVTASDEQTEECDEKLEMEQIEDGRGDDVDSKGVAGPVLNLSNINNGSEEPISETKKSVKKPLYLRITGPVKKLFGGKTNTHDARDAEMLVEYVKGQKKSSVLTQLKCYKMDHEFRGRVVLIDEAHFNKDQELSNRDGSDLDAKKLRGVFKKLGFEDQHIHILNNATSDTITQHLQSVAKQDFTNHDMFVCVILTHGESGRLHARDKIFPVEQLWEPFLEENCASLKGKPKFFIIQACRGTRLDPGVEVKSPKINSRQQSEDTADGNHQRKHNETVVASDHVVTLLTSLGDISSQDTVQVPHVNGHHRRRSDACSDILSQDTLQLPHVNGHHRRLSDSGMTCLGADLSDLRRPSLPAENHSALYNADNRRPSLPAEHRRGSLPSGDRRGSLPEENRRPSLNLDALRAQLMRPNPQVRRSSRDQVDAKPADSICLNSAHNVPDMLVAYSTVDGYYSFRRPTAGSWFIQAVCDKLIELYETEDLMSIMTRVNGFVATEMISFVSDRSKREFHQKKQVPCIASTLTKILYFSQKKLQVT